jgi:ADP-ribose pyrophosphatase YjhB (NUDIX family)
MMDDLTKDLTAYVIVYLDDILIFSENEKDHHEQVHIVLQRLRENDLFVKPEKCTWESTEVEYLGAKVSPGKVEMDYDKTKAIEEWPVPAKVKDVQSFLGFANFYRRFIQDFSKISKPLTSLIKKNQKWNWTPEAQIAFETLKKCFTTKPILQLPDEQKQFVIEADSSDYATGAILLQ